MLDLFSFVVFLPNFVSMLLFFSSIHAKYRRFKATCLSLRLEEIVQSRGELQINLFHK